MGEGEISAAIDSDTLRRYRLEEPLLLMRPTMPDLGRYHGMLEAVWDSRWLTNNGPMHERFERELARELGVSHLNILCNGTIAMLLGLQALRINGGEVITTPFSFPATTHVLFWNRVQPVFCDIEPETYNIDPSRIEEKITPDTRAILATHVFGSPCAVEEIERLARVHGLRVMYDAAHTFGVQYGGRSITEWGDLSALSFHATKLFSTGEGGALVCNSPELKRRIDYLKNFGIENEEHVIGPGINGKMTEMQAALGLLSLETYRGEIAARRELDAAYREVLEGVPGIRLLPRSEAVTHNYSYFPILVDAQAYGMDRDALHGLLKHCNIFARKYFYPLTSDYSCYRALPSARPENLPVARRVAAQVLCLPLCGGYSTDTVRRVADAIAAFQSA